MTAPVDIGHAARLVDALDDLRFESLEELAETAQSYWRSIAECAQRREPIATILHLKQASAVTRDAFQICTRLGKAWPDDEEPS
jgi:hypothetical protein